MTIVPVSYRFEGRIFWLKNAGESSVEELIEVFDTALADPAYPDRAVLLWDIRDSVSLKGRSAGDLQRITALLGPKAHRHSNTSAIVVSNDLYHGLMRMAAAYGEEFESNSRLFRDEGEALAWIASLDDEPAG